MQVESTNRQQYIMSRQSEDHVSLGNKFNKRNVVANKQRERLVYNVYNTEEVLTLPAQEALDEVEQEVSETAEKIVRSRIV